MDFKIIGDTENCIFCLKEATSHTGHVKQRGSNNHVLAGFCNKHAHWSQLNFSDKKGCYGYWNEKMGLKIS